jgi:hypothetical protein
MGVIFGSVFERTSTVVAPTLVHGAFTEVRGESPAVHGGDESDKPYINYVRRAERVFK